MAKRYAVHTLGCKANAYDGHLIHQELGRLGWSEATSQEAPDLIIVNSCTVTDEADKKSRKTASRMGRRHPNARVVLTGCGAEVSPERMAEVPGVHYVVGNQNKESLAELVLSRLNDDSPSATSGAEILGGVEEYAKIRAKHPMDRSWPVPEAAFLAPSEERKATRVFLKIQEGCNAFCTFCIIPYARGPARSLRPARVVEHVRGLCAQGVQEVVLTATDLGDYGIDLGDDGPRLEDLIELILRETALPRLRVSSLDPVEISPRLLRIMEQEPRLCPHFHVSLQSPHTEILKRMKRKYGAAQVDSTLSAVHDLGLRLEGQRALSGGVFAGMDVITGFPGETEEIFDWTYRKLEELPWHRLHVFPYSERQGTAATKLDGTVPKAERKRRVRALMKLSTSRLRARYEDVLQSGGPIRILVEGPVRGPDDSFRWVSGTTENYYRVIASHPNPDQLRNQMVDLFPTSVHVDERAGDVSLLGRFPLAQKLEQQL
jgi:threonylcarbamoyladenosine tRNA methylthiotransferase MtaB